MRKHFASPARSCNLKKAGAGLPILLLAGCLALVASNANATIITGTSTFTASNTAFPGPTGDYATLSISLNNSTGAATFTFTGDKGYEFIDSNVADVNLSSSNFTFSGLTPFAALSGTGSNTVDGFGTFTETTSVGNASTPYSTIAYTLTSADFVGLTSISQLLVTNAKGWDAAAHMCYVTSTSCYNGKTGFVAEGTGTPVPEPASVGLLGFGLLGLELVRRMAT